MWIVEGLRPSLKSLPPLLEKERGIKGVRLKNNLDEKRTRLMAML